MKTLTPAAISAMLGAPIRWNILRTLSLATEPLMVLQIAEQSGHEYSATSKQLNHLLRLGAVLKNRAGLYAIDPAFRPAPGQLDFGPCLLRFHAEQGS